MRQSSGAPSWGMKGSEPRGVVASKIYEAVPYPQETFGKCNKGLRWGGLPLPQPLPGVLKRPL